MKRILLTGLLVIPFLANAQFSKGDKVLGGTLSFYSQDASDSQNGGLTNDVKTFSIAPKMAVLLNGNFALGGELSYSFSQQKMSYYPSLTLEFNSKSFSAGIFGQRYFELSDKFLFSLIGQFSFARGFDTDHDFDPVSGLVTENKTEDYQLTTSIRPNFIFFPSPKWGFEASIGTISYTFSHDLTTDDNSNFFSFNYGAITFGLAYYFRKSATR